MQDWGEGWGEFKYMYNYGRKCNIVVGMEDNSLSTLPAWGFPTNNFIDEKHSTVNDFFQKNYTLINTGRSGWANIMYQ